MIFFYLPRVRLTYLRFCKIVFTAFIIAVSFLISTVLFQPNATFIRFGFSDENFYVLYPVLVQLRSELSEM